MTERSHTMTPLEAEELSLKNKYYPQAQEAQINWRNSGGSGAGVGQKEIMALQRQLSLEHPNGIRILLIKQQVLILAVKIHYLVEKRCRLLRE